RLDPLRPIGAAELVLDDLGAVEPVLDVIAVDDEARGVPFTGPLHDPRGGRVHRVVGAGGGEPRAAIHVAGIVEHLHLGRVPVDRVSVFAGPVENAGVA